MHLMQPTTPLTLEAIQNLKLYLFFSFKMIGAEAHLEAPSCWAAVEFFFLAATCEYNLSINKYIENMYYLIKSININPFIKAKMLLLSKKQKQRSAPMLCLSFSVLRVAGIHWKNALEMPSMKRCPYVLVAFVV
jgi:hypothetical protein